MTHIKKEINIILKSFKNNNDITKGFIFSGKSGTGKTLMAKAIAGECDMDFIEITSHGSYLNDLEIIIKAILKKHKNCVLFIDEAEDIISKDMSKILKILDGFTSEKILLIIAGNDLSSFNKSLSRSGRIDQIINFSFPPSGDRIIHLKTLFSTLTEEEIKQIDNNLENFTHADIISINKQLKLEECDQDRTLKDNILNVIFKMKHKKDSNFQLGIEKNKISNSSNYKERIAYHEIGHLLVAYMGELTHKPISITIQNRTTNLVKKFDSIPILKDATIYGEVENKVNNIILTETDIYCEICYLLASSVFEKKYFGCYSNLCEVDFIQIGEKFDLLKRCRFIPYKWISSDNKFSQYKNHILNICEKFIIQIINENEDIIQNLKDKLFEKEILYEYEIRQIIPEKLISSKKLLIESYLKNSY